MLRPFPLALDLGAYQGLLGQSVAQLPSVGATIYAESVFELADYVRGPRLSAMRICCPSERPASISLSLASRFIASTISPGALIQIRRALAPDGLFMAAALGAGAAHRASPRSPRGGGRDARRREPAGRALRRCSRLWRAPSARGLRSSRRRRREDAYRRLHEPPRIDARDPRARWRQRASRAHAKAPSRKTLERAEALYRERHPLSDGGVRAPSRSSISPDGDPIRASRNR